jgi:hypothetical protein
MKINKFNIHWQIERVKVKNIKDVSKKLESIKSFLIANNNIFNMERIRNWANMLMVSNISINDKKLVNVFINVYLPTVNKNSLNVDNNNNLHNISTNHLKMVYKDLSKRKYNFQFNKTPKDHIEFINDIEMELLKRGEKYGI